MIWVELKVRITFLDNFHGRADLEPRTKYEVEVDNYVHLFGWFQANSRLQFGSNRFLLLCSANLKMRVHISSLSNFLFCFKFWNEVPCPEFIVIRTHWLFLFGLIGNVNERNNGNFLVGTRKMSFRSQPAVESLSSKCKILQTSKTFKNKRETTCCLTKISHLLENDLKIMQTKI